MHPITKIIIALIFVLIVAIFTFILGLDTADDPAFQKKFIYFLLVVLIVVVSFALIYTKENYYNKGHAAGFKKGLMCVITNEKFNELLTTGETYELCSIYLGDENKYYTVKGNFTDPFILKCKNEEDIMEGNYGVGIYLVWTNEGIFKVIEKKEKPE